MHKIYFKKFTMFIKVGHKLIKMVWSWQINFYSTREGNCNIFQRRISEKLVHFGKFSILIFSLTEPGTFRQPHLDKKLYHNWQKVLFWLIYPFLLNVINQTILPSKNTHKKKDILAHFCPKVPLKWTWNTRSTCYWTKAVCYYHLGSFWCDF